MSYYLDFDKISLDEYKSILKKVDLVPSRVMLLDDIDNKFEQLKSFQILKLSDLFQRLKTKKQVSEFSKDSGFSEEYLNILIRELKSIRPKPNRIIDFPLLSSSVSEKLKNLGIKNTKQFYEISMNPNDRNSLSYSSKIGLEVIIYLTKLSDLSRIKWVNHTFAFILLETGYESVQAVANANADELHLAVNQINKEKGFYKGHIGLRDVNRCIEAAMLLPRDIEW